MATRQQYEEALKLPHVKAFLDAIAYSEIGKDASNGGGYGSRFGVRGQMADLSRHPQVKVSAGGYNSSAAGRYQFLSNTWNGVAKKLGLPDFGPHSQDLAALALIDERGAFNDLVSGRLESAQNKLGRVWAALPSSTYRQPKRTPQFFYGQLNYALNKYDPNSPYFVNIGGQRPMGNEMGSKNSKHVYTTTPAQSSMFSNFSTPMSQMDIASLMKTLYTDPFTGRSVTPDTIRQRLNDRFSKPRLAISSQPISKDVVNSLSRGVLGLDPIPSVPYPQKMPFNVNVMQADIDRGNGPLHVINPPQTQPIETFQGTAVPDVQSNIQERELPPAALPVGLTTTPPALDYSTMLNFAYIPDLAGTPEPYVDPLDYVYDQAFQQQATNTFSNDVPAPYATALLDLIRKTPATY